MGYYTRFELKVTNKAGDEITDAVHPEWSEETLYQGGLSVSDLINGDTDSMKWYDHEKDMLELSVAYPDYLFTLDGDGEESGDVWREFYMNGKTYSWKLEYTRPEFNKKKLA